MCDHPEGGRGYSHFTNGETEVKPSQRSGTGGRGGPPFLWGLSRCPPCVPPQPGSLEAALPGHVGWQGRAGLGTWGQAPWASGRGQLGRTGVSLPRHRGQALIAFFRGLCAACSFIVDPTQCRGELRSDFQPSALDFLSFVGWRTDYATRLPVISAPGPAPWR